MRKLTVALTEKGERVHIDNFSKDTYDGALFCPHCKMEIIPKQGDNKIWHFAHKGMDCDFGNLKTEDKETHNDSLGAFMTKTTTLDNYKFAKATKFLCPICNETYPVIEGKEWSKEEYLCKKCFMHITPEQTKILMNRNILK